jgi:lipopolysaccharide transport system permease protein
MGFIASNQMINLFKLTWSYRGYIASSVKREFQIRYRNSLLGAAWNVLNPLSMVVIYTVIFSQVMRARLPGVDGAFDYSIYLCAGVITWGLFSEIISRGQNVFLENANLIKKLNFPRLCLPVIVVFNAWLNFLIIFLLFLVFLIFVNRLPGLPLLAIIPLLAIQTLLGIGIGITVGVLNVFFRDVGHLVGIVLQFWFWLTPVIYPLAALPEWARSLSKYFIEQ